MGNASHLKDKVVRQIKQVMNHRRFAILGTLFVVGICAAFLAFIAAFLIISLFQPDGDWRRPFSFCAALSALLLGPYLWWYLIIKPRRLTVKRGIRVGVLGGFLAYPLAWFLAVLPGIQTMHFEYYLEMAISSSLASMLLVGWLTALLGGGAGAVVAKLQITCRCQQRWYAAN
jgi:hypothetical protein